MGIANKDLGHAAPTEGHLHWGHFPIAIALIDHHLRPIGMFKQRKALCRTGEDRGKAQNPGPERIGFRKILDHHLGDKG